MDLSFLKAQRFWAMVLGLVAVYLEKYGFALSAVGVAEFLQMFCAGFLGVQTFDRTVDKLAKK